MSEGRKRIRPLKKVRAAMTAVGRKAAGKSEKPSKHISAPCAGGLGELVSAIQKTCLEAPG